MRDVTPDRFERWQPACLANDLLALIEAAKRQRRQATRLVRRSPATLVFLDEQLAMEAQFLVELAVDGAAAGDVGESRPQLADAAHEASSAGFKKRSITLLTVPSDRFPRRAASTRAG